MKQKVTSPTSYSLYIKRLFNIIIVAYTTLDLLEKQFDSVVTDNTTLWVQHLC